MSGGDVIRQFFGAMASGDLEAAKALVRDDLVMEWPQSGELFRGRDNAFGAMSVQADRPESAGEPRIVGSGDVWVVQMRLRYASGLSHTSRYSSFAMARWRAVRGTSPAPSRLRPIARGSQSMCECSRSTTPACSRSSARCPA